MSLSNDQNPQRLTANGSIWQRGDGGRFALIDSFDQPGVAAIRR
jgi:hypothetical protein